MSNFFEIECSINDNPNNLEIINYDVNEIVISPCLPTTPSDYIDIINGQINNFIFSGSGINLVPTSTGLYIESELFGGSGIIVSENSGIYTINTNDSYIDSLIQDGFNTNLAAGSGIIFSYDNDTLYLNSIIQAGKDIGITNQSGIYTVAFTGVYPSGDFSLVGHQHLSTDITNFDSAVSGLIPNVNGSGYINSNFSNNSYTISVSGLQPSGNYSLVGHTHESTDITDFNSAVSGLVPTINVSAGSGIIVDLTESMLLATNTIKNFTIHSDEQYIDNIVDNNFNTNLVAGTGIIFNYDTNTDTLSLNSIIQAGANISITNQSGIYTIASSGLQPSGNYSLVGHTHTASQITDFNSSVSGLIPPQSVTSIIGVSGVVVTNSGSAYTVALSNPTIQLSNISDLSTDARTFLLTPSSNNLQILVNDETGSGSLVFNNSPSFSGIPTVPTAPSGTNNNQIASTQFVRSEIANLVDSAPSTLDTLNELAAALGDDANFSTTVTNSLAGKANLSGATFTGPVVIPSGTGNFNSLTINNIDVSVSGHTHTYTDITNFGSGVSNSLTTTLLPGSFIVLDYNSGLDTLTISASGLQPSGNYSTVGHTHTSSDITDFNSSVSGLLPVKNVLGSGYINVSSSSGIYTVIATGLQPSGNYSTVGHTHVSSDITNFNSSVSGLLPVKDIVSGSGIGITSSSGIYTISSTVNEVAQAASLVTTVFNKTGSPIPKMSAVYVSGGQGDMPTVSLAIATSDMTSAGTYGLAYETINNMSSGKVIVFGALTGLNTDQFNPTSPHGDVNGTVLYLSPTTSGLITKTKPSAPNHIVAIGTIVRTHQNEGVIEVRIQNGFELEELHNVAISGVTNGQFLQYNSASQLWVPSSSGNFSTLQVNGTGVSLSGHTHTSSSITDFNSSVSGLLPSISGSGYVSSNFINNIYTISVSGLQPSGDYSLSGHTHTASNITDFNSSVSGLLPVTSIIGGTNISVVPSGSQYTISVSGSLGLTTEEVDDRVSNLLVSGSGIVLNYDDNANTLNISTSGLQPSGNYSLVGHTHTSSDISDFNEAVDDRVGSGLLVAGSGIALNYNDAANTLTINSLVSPTIRQTYSITTTQSVFTVSVGYTVGVLDVYHNGIKLVSGEDYVATNGTQFTLVNSAISGDIVEAMTSMPSVNLQDAMRNAYIHPFLLAGM